MTCVRRELGGTQVTRREGAGWASQPPGSRPRAAAQTPPGNSMRLGARAGLGGAAEERGLSLNHFEVGIRVRRKVSARRPEARDKLACAFASRRL